MVMVMVMAMAMEVMMEILVFMNFPTIIPHQHLVLISLIISPR